MAWQISGPEGAGKAKRKPRFLAFWSDRKGAALFEFAIVALPLFLLFFGIIEVGLIFWGTMELENATMDAARLVRTGQAQTMSAADFKTKICNAVFILKGCSANVQVSIQIFPGGFSSMTLPPQLDSNRNLLTTFNGDPTQAGSGQDVLITAYYPWQIIDPLTRAVLSNMSGGKILLQSAAAFRTEPF